jgi:PAS domain S-box-containing protein
MAFSALTSPLHRRSALSRYGLALGLSLGFVGLRGALHPVLGGTLPLQLLTFAVLVSAWWGGWGAGLLATTLCALAGAAFFLPPRGDWHISLAADAIHLLAFIFTGVAISAIAEALHRAVWRERQQTEALRVSEERLRLAVQATEDAVWDWDLANDTLGWSPAVAERFGWPEAQPGTDADWWKERVHAEDRARVMQSIREALDDPVCQHWEAEYRFHRGDGSIAEVLDRGFVLRDTSGRALRMIGAMLDLTPRKRADAELRRSREQVQAIIDTVPSLISYVDRDLIYRWNSRGYERWFQRPLAQITGHSMREVLGEAAFARVYPRMQKALAGELTEYEDFLPYEGVGGRWVHAIYAQQRGPDGQVEGVVICVTDISERKRVEAEVREAAEQRRLALEGAGLGTWDYRFTTGEVLGDERFFRMLGIMAEKLDYEAALACLHAEDREAAHAAAQTALAGGDDGKLRMEIRVNWADGSLHWLDVHGCVYFTGAAGARQPLRFIGVTMDITERKRAMEAVRLTNARFEAALRASPVVVTEQDRELRYTWIQNSSIGRTTADVFGKTDSDLLERPEEAETLAAIKRAVLETGTSRRLEFTVHVQGKERTYDFCIEPRRDEAGRMAGVNCAAVDMTAHKQAAEALRQSREALSLALTGAKMGTWELDMRTGELQWSDRTFELFGLPPGGSFHRAKFLAAVHPEDHARIADAVRAAAEQEPHNYECEYRALLPHGAVRWLFARGAVHLDATTGTPVRMAGVIMDVTDRVVAAEQIATALGAAEAANTAKDAFLAALSHELRTPLTPVLFVAASHARSADLAPALREDFAMIRRNIELEARLIDDLLDLTRISRGKLHLDLEPTDLHALLARTLEMVRGDIQAKQITVTLDLAAERHQASADAVRLQQVFWNVLKNAVKFTPEHGRIAVHSRCPAGDTWHVAVSDSGLGITAEELPRIFDAFAQGEEASSHRFGGLGLGLAISGLLVHEHGGRIWAESAGRDQGAAFHLELPLRTSHPAAEGPVEPEVPMAALPSRRILVVEDHEPTRETLARLLTKRGYEVSLAGTAARARQLAAETTFDLMVSDLGLPDGSGHELAADFGRDYGLRAIALSGYGMEEDVRRSRTAGFLDHLTKPVEIEELYRAILRATAK